VWLHVRILTGSSQGLRLSDFDWDDSQVDADLDILAILLSGQDK